MGENLPWFASLSLLCSIAHVCPFRMLPVSIALEPTTFQQTTHGLPSDASDASKSPFTLMGFKSSTEISKVHRILGGIVRSRFATHHVGHQMCFAISLYLSLSLSLSISSSKTGFCNVLFPFISSILFLQNVERLESLCFARTAQTNLPLTSDTQQEFHTVAAMSLGALIDENSVGRRICH